MMFVDTGGWFALSDRREARHADGTALFRQAGRGEFGRLVTTDYVLDATDSLLRFRRGLSAVRTFSERVLGSSNVQILRVSEGDCERALARMLDREGKRRSFTDCTSFVVMETLAIRRAFGFDGKFREAGFELLPERPGGLG
ncbi:MAG: PIN domain-containing protein [Thermoplasmata archaeon]|nr:PIN domain-containing protein [Thermoplasmata archaeon]